MSQLAFDGETGKRLEALYRTQDAERRRRLVRGALAATAGERILDVGCGPGFYCAELLQDVGPSGSIVGVDSSPQMLALAARRCQGHPHVNFHQADATALPVEDASFDGAICVQVLEYVPEVAVTLEELYRVLRPGGRVVVWDIDWATVSMHSADPDRMDRVLTAWDKHLAHPCLPRTLATAMRSAGFRDVLMEGHTFATAEFDPDMYGAATVPLIANFVPGHSGVSKEEATAWALEQRDLGARHEFYFACVQLCFSGTRPS